MESKHSDRLLPLNLNLILVIFSLPNTTYSFMDLHPEITLWLSVFKLAKTTSIQKGSLKNEKIEHENIYQLANACSISRLIPAVWSHMLYVWVWESWWILFTLEKSEMLGSPILKLTGPFGSNHHVSWKKPLCHGARDARTLPASIFYFKAGNWCQFDCTYVKSFSWQAHRCLVQKDCSEINNCLFISSDTLTGPKV